jgi:hypothetical protein
MSVGRLIGQPVASGAIRGVGVGKIAGGGRRLLDGLPSIQLESIRNEISPTGYLLVDYRVIRQSS